MKVYRGNPAAARHYVEADHARVDDYYLAEGTGVAERFTASPSGSPNQGVRHLDSLDGEGYEAWVAGLDPATGEARGRLRQDPQSVRFVEVVVNGPKSWSLAAALHPEVAAAYDAAMDRAASQIIGWLAEHATTRVGPRGRQVQVPVERIEAVTVRHYTSRAGDPHRHLHLQINARVFAEGKWRGLHTVGVRDSLEAINGIGHAAMMTDPEFRGVLAAHGYTVNAAGEIEQLAPFVGPFSARSRQIATNVDRYEAEWRTAHPGQEPGPALVRAWDRRAWADARPDKVVPIDGSELTDRWVEELHRLGFREPTGPARLLVSRTGALDRDAAVEMVLTRLGVKRSGWNAADVRGQVELLIAREGIVTDAAIRCELADDLTARVVRACVSLLAEEETPRHIRSLTSREVLAVEADITTRLAARADGGGARLVRGGDLDDAQRRAVGVLAGSQRLVVIEGAAGTGKTATLAATRWAIEHGTGKQDGRRLVVVTPTLKAAQVAKGEVGSQAFSAAWFAHQYGFRWDSDGRWTREPTERRPDASLRAGDLMLVDEAGMLDQDTARALLTIADETGARVALVGDRHQLPAVGRGGVLDLAARWADPNAVVELDVVHRFADPEYAELSLVMRAGDDPGDVFDQLVERGQVVVHSNEANRTTALAQEAAATGALIVADTREQVAALNAAIHDRLLGERVDGRVGVVTHAGERVCVGDRVATRRNDYELGVANRDTWTITGIGDDGALRLRGMTDERVMPLDYAAQHVELAYASTVYGAQGETVTAAHLALGDATGAASAYVAMTRGRQANTVHVVAEDLDDARRQWVEAFARDRADLGPAHAAKLAAQESAKYANAQPLGDPASAADPRRYAPRVRRRALARTTRERTGGRTGVGTGAHGRAAPLPTGEPPHDHGRVPGIGL